MCLLNKRAFRELQCPSRRPRPTAWTTSLWPLLRASSVRHDAAQSVAQRGAAAPHTTTIRSPCNRAFPPASLWTGPPSPHTDLNRPDTHLYPGPERPESAVAHARECDGGARRRRPRWMDVFSAAPLVLNPRMRGYSLLFCGHLGAH